MMKFNKAYNFLLILILIVIFLCQDVYALRVPIGGYISLKEATTENLTKKTSEELLKRVPAWMGEYTDAVNFIVSLGIESGDIVLDVGTAGHFIYGVLSAALGANYIGFDLEAKKHKTVRRILRENFQTCNLSKFGGSVEHKNTDFVDYARKNVRDNAVRFVFGLTAVEEDKDTTFNLKTTSPLKHNPIGGWSYLTHTGIVEPTCFERLVLLALDLSRAKEEIFCCFNATDDSIAVWKRAAGFLVDISNGGEILYAGDARDDPDVIYPFRMGKQEVAGLKERLRKNKIIEKAPEGYRQEVDITGGDIVGVFVEINSTKIKPLSEWKEEFLNQTLSSSSAYLRNFNLMMGIAINNNLPIVILNSGADPKEYTILVEKFKRILDNHNIDNSDSILKQITPSLESYKTQYISDIEAAQKAQTQL